MRLSSSGPRRRPSLDNRDSHCERSPELKDEISKEVKKATDGLGFRV